MREYLSVDGSYIIAGDSMNQESLEITKSIWKRRQQNETKQNRKELSLCQKCSSMPSVRAKRYVLLAIFSVIHWQLVGVFLKPTIRLVYV